MKVGNGYADIIPVICMYISLPNGSYKPLFVAAVTNRNLHLEATQLESYV